MQAAQAASPEWAAPKKKATKPGWDEQLMEPDKKAERAKKKAAVGQSPSLGKEKAVALAQLTRAPISQPTKKAMTPILQEPQQLLAPQVVELPPPGVLQAERAPVVVAPPPMAEQQPGSAFLHMPPSRPFQTFQEVYKEIGRIAGREASRGCQETHRKGERGGISGSGP